MRYTARDPEFRKKFDVIIDITEWDDILIAQDVSKNITSNKKWDIKQKTGMKAIEL